MSNESGQERIEQYCTEENGKRNVTLMLKDLPADPGLGFALHQGNHRH